jgi:hypothetical protein
MVSHPSSPWRTRATTIFTIFAQLPHGGRRGLAAGCPSVPFQPRHHSTLHETGH